MKINVNKIANYSFLPIAIIIIITLGLYSIIQNLRFFNVIPKTTTFNAVQNLKIKIDTLEDKYILAKKRPDLYQELYIINIVVLLLITILALYYFMDWDLLFHVLTDILTV